MRHIVATFAVAVLATGLASAQYKPAPQTQSTSTNSTVQITPTPPPAAEPTQEEARRISQDEAIKMVKEKRAVWVDVRSKDQYDLGHIKGAMNIPLGDIITRLKEIPPKMFIITYCA